MKQSRPRVALIGSRGVPARYGGFESLFEELSIRLAQSGYDVTVYCRSHYTPRSMTSHRGVRLVVLPTVRTKYLDTPVHSLLSCVHALGQHYDAAIVANSANALFIPLLRLAGVPTALHVDGIEKRRTKWGWPGRLIHALSERLSTRFPDRVITDAIAIRDHYLSRYGARSELITYGVDPRPTPPGKLLARLGLKPRQYFLYVSRFEPENNPHRVVEAYREVGGDLPLVMVGDAPYAARFIRSFTRDADPRVKFPGAIYGGGYRELLSHARAFVQASEVGGSHPALIEAMGYGNCVIVNDTAENREVVGDAGLYFRVSQKESLTMALESLLSSPRRGTEMADRAAQRAKDRYTWEKVVQQYRVLLEELGAADGSRVS